MNKSKNLSKIIKITLLTQALAACSFPSNTNLLSDTQNLPNPSAKSESQENTKIKKPAKRRSRSNSFTANQFPSNRKSLSYKFPPHQTATIAKY
ncbi:hypothetical protein [Rappaport israeli]|uniref:hypothetical protein n=1 Tax=Rappaport israeli TaxID=1839807 RepID=UPI000930E1CB|nr:hypothetical protein [Rappaport israeli]